MLIGIDASRAVATRRTGTENYSFHLISELLRLGMSHRFRLYFNQAPQADLFPRDARVCWCEIPFPRLWTHVRLACEVARHPPDVLFVPSHVVPVVHPRRCVATVHDLGYLHYPAAHTRCSRLYLDWSTRHNARVSRRIIADSEATRQDLLSWYRVPAEKVTVAYPAGAAGLAPVHDKLRLDSVRQRYGTGERYFLFVGTLQPRKNLVTLIDAFADLIGSAAIDADVRLVLAGKQGWLCEEILARAKAADVSGRVVLPGYVRSDDLSALLSGALAFVLPSWHEGFGLPILEAMSCDTPVICSRVASLPEVGGDAVLYFDPADVKGLSAALKRLCDEPALGDELVLRGRRRLEAFSWERCAQQVMDTLEAAGAERDGRGAS